MTKKEEPITQEKEESLIALEDAALQAAMTNIRKKYGPGAILSSADKLNHDVVPTRLISLNRILGGGIPRGRVIEIYGPEAVGKTSLALEIVASFQAAKLKCAYIDMEQALDEDYAKELDTDMDAVVISQPACAEEALGILDILVKSEAVGLVVVDSVAALVPKAELEGDMGDSHPGLVARLMGQALRKITPSANISNTTVVFINQIRANINTFGYGPKDTTTGGNALKFYATQRLDIRRIGAIKEGDQVVGNRTRVRVVKNKIAPPFKEAEFDIIYGRGISKEGDILDLGVNLGLVEKSGAWYSFEGERIGQGRENVKRFLNENQDIRDRIGTLVMEKTGLKRHEKRDQKLQEQETQK